MSNVWCGSLIRKLNFVFESMMAELFGVLDSIPTAEKHYGNSDFVRK
jgi:hypothetical protein